MKCVHCEEERLSWRKVRCNSFHNNNTTTTAANLCDWHICSLAYNFVIAHTFKKIIRLNGSFFNTYTVLPLLDLSLWRHSYIQRRCILTFLFTTYYHRIWRGRREVESNNFQRSHGEKWHVYAPAEIDFFRSPPAISWHIHTTPLSKRKDLLPSLVLLDISC